MNRRTFSSMVVLTSFVRPLGAEGQQPAKIWRIGFLSAASPEYSQSWLAAFRHGLRELGYVEGKNLVIDERYAAGRLEGLPELSADLVRLKVDVLAAHSGLVADAAKKATSTIPIVMVAAADPVGMGVVASLARPGGNVTGLSDFHPGLVTKRLELLKEVVPSASRVAILVNPANPTHPPQVGDIQAAAPALRVTPLFLEVKGPDDIDRAFTRIGRERPGALLVLGDPVIIGVHLRRIADLAVKSRIPTISTVRKFPDEGGLMSYGTSFDDLYRRAATYVDKILKGAKPADLPVEQPTKFDLVINLKTAKALGLSIPQSLLLRADQLIP